MEITTCADPEVWIESINLVMNGVAVWMLILLFADQRRIEKRYSVLLGEMTNDRP